MDRPSASCYLGACIVSCTRESTVCGGAACVDGEATITIDLCPFASPQFAGS